MNKHILVVLRIGHVNERGNVEEDFVYRIHRCWLLSHIQYGSIAAKHKLFVFNRLQRSTESFNTDFVVVKIISFEKIE